MVKSMTGFGRSEVITPEYRMAVEMKAVNHRYLDLSIKMPRRFNSLEAQIRAVLKEYMERGKVDVYINYEDYAENRVSLKYNRSMAAEYVKYFGQMTEEFGIANDITTSRMASLPEVFLMEEEDDDEEHLWKILEPVVRSAAEKFVEARVREGENLRADMLAKLDEMTVLVDEIIERSPAIVEEYRTKLLDKVRELIGGTQLDESLIATEVTAYADKICTDEETVRLKSHIGSTRNELEKGGSVGRKLDFIAQEMNREANTILSKANDISVSDRAILLKTGIEKVREQIQNLE